MQVNAVGGERCVIVAGAVRLRQRPTEAPEEVAGREEPQREMDPAAGPEEGPSEVARAEAARSEAGPPRRASVRRPPLIRKAPEESKEPQEAARLLKEAETLFIDGEVDKAAELFTRIVKDYPDGPSAEKARGYLELLE